MKKHLLAISVSLISFSALADIGSWTRNSHAVKSPEMSNTLEDSDKNISSERGGDKNINDKLNDSAITSKNNSDNHKNSMNKNIENNYSSPSRDYTPTNSYGNNTARSNYAAQDIELIKKYAYESLNFTKSNEFNHLSNDAQFAYLMLNSTLLTVGMNQLNKIQDSNSLVDLTKAVGCINSFKNNQLSSMSNSLINKHLRFAPISSAVNQVPRIGSSYVNKCD